MKKIIACILMSLGGFMMAHIGFPCWKWQFWAVMLPIVIGVRMDMESRNK